MKKVSIIIPCYNNEKHVWKAVKSIKEQTFKDFEAIFVDDGSTDKTIEKAKKEACGDKRFSFVFAEHGGVASARNIGINESCGEYIMFLDADDALKNDSLEKLVSAADESGADIISGGFAKTFGEKVLDKVSPSYDGFYEGKKEVEKILEKACVGSDAALTSFIVKLYRADLIKNNCIVFPPMASGEDSIFALEALICSKSIYFIKNHVFYFYEQNPNSFTQKSLSLKARIAYSDEFFSGMQSVIKKHGMEELLCFLDVRKALAIYDFVMNTVAKNDIDKKEKKEGIYEVSKSNYCTNALGEGKLDVRSFDLPHKVKYLALAVINKQINKAYLIAILINNVKKILGKSI